MIELFALAAHQAAFALEGFLCLGNDVAQDIEFFRHGGAAAEDDLGEFLQLHQPEWQVERIGVDDHGVIGEGGGEFVVRIEDQHAQLRIGLDRFVKQQGHGGRFADAGGADDGEMLGEHRGHVDGGIQALVLGEGADDAGFLSAGIVDAGEVGGADAVGDRAEIGILADAGGKFFLTGWADMDFAHQLDFDAEGVVDLLAPFVGGGLHGIDQRDDAVFTDADGNEAADGPEFGEGGFAVFGDGGDRGARAAAGDDATQEAVAPFQDIAPFLFSRAHRGMEIAVQQVAPFS